MVAAIALILILEESTDGEEELGILVVGLGSSEALLRGCFAESKYECLRRGPVPDVLESSDFISSHFLLSYFLLVKSKYDSRWTGVCPNKEGKRRRKGSSKLRPPARSPGKIQHSSLKISTFSLLGKFTYFAEKLAEANRDGDILEALQCVVVGELLAHCCAIFLCYLGCEMMIDTNNRNHLVGQLTSHPPPYSLEQC